MFDSKKITTLSKAFQPFSISAQAALLLGVLKMEWDFLLFSFPPGVLWFVMCVCVRVFAFLWFSVCETVLFNGVSSLGPRQSAAKTSYSSSPPPWIIQVVSYCRCTAWLLNWCWTLYLQRFSKHKHFAEFEQSIDSTLSFPLPMTKRGHNKCATHWVILERWKVLMPN